MREKLQEWEKKQKITVSINENLLTLVDEQTEKNNSKRSHVIEKALIEHFANNTTTKLIVD